VVRITLDVGRNALIHLGNFQDVVDRAGLGEKRLSHNRRSVMRAVPLRRQSGNSPQLQNRDRPGSCVLGLKEH